MQFQENFGLDDLLILLSYISVIRFIFGFLEGDADDKPNFDNAKNSVQTHSEKMAAVEAGERNKIDEEGEKEASKPKPRLFSRFKR